MDLAAHRSRRTLTPARGRTPARHRSFEPRVAPVLCSPLWTGVSSSVTDEMVGSAFGLPRSRGAAGMHLGHAAMAWSRPPRIELVGEPPLARLRPKNPRTRLLPSAKLTFSAPRSIDAA